MIISRIWRLIPHGCQYLCHSALATYMALIFDANAFSLTPFPTLLSCRLSLKFLFNFIQFSFGGSLMLFTSFLYLMYLLYHKIFCLSTVFLRFLKFSEGFRPYLQASAPCPVLLSLSYVFIITDDFLFVKGFLEFFLLLFASTTGKISNQGALTCLFFPP